jgi:hypothetical protein
MGKKKAPKKPVKTAADANEVVNAEPKPIGRPSAYTPELGDLICGLLAEGQSLVTILQARKHAADLDGFWVAGTRERG